MAEKKMNNLTTPKAIGRQFTGEVVRAGADKTISVIVRTSKMHPKYKKQYWVSKKYAVHDEKDAAAVGDTVVFQECRPLSKTKRWRLITVMKSAE